jgi:hypothetical protein
MLVLATIAFASSSWSEKSAISAEGRVTWMSAAQPEVHLLVKSDDQSEREVSVALPSSVECAGRRASPDAERRSIFRSLTPFHESVTVGAVSEHRWLHRSFPVGGFFSMDLPCVVGFKITDWKTGATLLDGKISVPASREPHDWLPQGERDLSVTMQIERDEDFKNLYILRLLVENKESNGILAAETERMILCPAGTEAEWALRPGVLQGEDTGPAWIPGGSWGVFVNAIHLRKGRLAGCEVRVDLSANIRLEGLVPVKSVREVLRVDGTIWRPSRRGSAH